MPNILWIDTETTGVRPEKHDIIQISGCVQLMNGELVDWFDFKLKPLNFDTIDDGALAVNKTTREELFLYPDAQTQLELFFELIGKYAKDYNNRLSVGGYNVKFDINMLQYELYKIYGEEAGGKMYFKYFTSRFLDPFALIPMVEEKTGKTFKAPKLTEVYKTIFNEDLEGAHDAKHDIYATVKLYYFFQKLFINK